MNEEAEKEFRIWLGTFSMPNELRENKESQAIEVSELIAAFEKAGAKSASNVRAIFQHLKETAKVRAWPTVHEILSAGREARRSAPKNASGGNRASLSRDELYKLETEIIPTARRWLGISGLRAHGEDTLRYWDEEF